MNGTTYRFAGWSDGQAQNHTLAAPPESTTYVARYAAVAPEFEGFLHPTPGVQYDKYVQLSRQNGVRLKVPGAGTFYTGARRRLLVGGRYGRSGHFARSEPGARA